MFEMFNVLCFIDIDLFCENWILSHNKYIQFFAKDQKSYNTTRDFIIMSFNQNANK